MTFADVEATTNRFKDREAGLNAVDKHVRGGGGKLNDGEEGRNGKERRRRDVEIKRGAVGLPRGRRHVCICLNTHT